MKLEGGAFDEADDEAVDAAWAEANPPLSETVVGIPFAADALGMPIPEGPRIGEPPLPETTDIPLQPIVDLLDPCDDRTRRAVIAFIKEWYA